jgi:hypothetical protein
VSRKQIYKQIAAGTLSAIRIGPRLWRLRTSEARRFERAALMTVPQPPERHAAATPQRRTKGRS